jgi:hypothetical protein
MKDSFRMMNSTVKESSRTAMDQFIMDFLGKDVSTDMESSNGRMDLFIEVTISMDKGRETANFSTPRTQAFPKADGSEEGLLDRGSTRTIVDK